MYETRGFQLFVLFFLVFLSMGIVAGHVFLGRVINLVLCYLFVGSWRGEKVLRTRELLLVDFVDCIRFAFINWLETVESIFRFKSSLVNRLQRLHLFGLRYRYLLVWWNALLQELLCTTFHLVVLICIRMKNLTLSFIQFCGFILKHAAFLT